MQIALGKRGDYAVRAVLELARYHGQGRRKAREIAPAMDIPERYLPQILATLVRHQLLIATAGPEGGYELARPPAEISLLEVVEAAEGPLAAEECLLRGGPCDWENACPLHHPWARAQQALADQLQRTDFQQLANTDADIETGRAAAPKFQLHARPVERRGQRDTASKQAHPQQSPRSKR